MPCPAFDLTSSCCPPSQRPLSLFRLPVRVRISHPIPSPFCLLSRRRDSPSSSLPLAVWLCRLVQPSSSSLPLSAGCYISASSLLVFFVVSALHCKLPLVSFVTIPYTGTHQLPALIGCRRQSQNCGFLPRPLEPSATSSRPRPALLLLLVLRPSLHVNSHSSASVDFTLLRLRFCLQASANSTSLSTLVPAAGSFLLSAALLASRVVLSTYLSPRSLQVESKRGYTSSASAPDRQTYVRFLQIHPRAVPEGIRTVLRSFIRTSHRHRISPLSTHQPLSVPLLITQTTTTATKPRKPSFNGAVPHYTHFTHNIPSKVGPDIALWLPTPAYTTPQSLSTQCPPPPQTIAIPTALPTEPIPQQTMTMRIRTHPPPPPLPQFLM